MFGLSSFLGSLFIKEAAKGLALALRVESNLFVSNGHPEVNWEALVRQQVLRKRKERVGLVYGGEW